MAVHPDPAVTLLGSGAYWLVLSLLVGGLANWLPEAWLICPPLRPSQHVIPGIRRWKRWIPDAGGVLPGGVPKTNLVQRDPQVLQQLAAETRRAELVHWVLWAGWLPTLFWLPPRGVGINLCFACLFNIPCLLLQRHTRSRVERCLQRWQGKLLITPMGYQGAEEGVAVASDPEHGVND